MPVIITATDFSEVAENAVNYACQLALATKARVIVLHSFLMPLMFSDVPLPGSIVVDEQRDAEAQMKLLTDSLQQRYPSLQLTSDVIYGNTIDVLESYREGTDDPWMAVVGNSSLNVNNTWTESVLINAFKALQYPVLAVPPGATFRPVNRLCFAMDNKPEGYDTAIKNLADITLQMTIQLHVLNVQAPQGRGEKATGQQLHKEILERFNPIYHFVNDAANIDDAILDFIEKNAFDWLVLMPRRHRLLDSLLHKSHTRALIHQSHIPILAIHETTR